MRRRGKGQHFCLTFPQPKTCSFLTQKKKKWKGLLKKDFPAEVDGSHTRFMLSLPFYRSKIFFLLMLYPDSLRFHTQSPCTWPTKSFLKAFPPAIRQFLKDYNGNHVNKLAHGLIFLILMTCLGHMQRLKRKKNRWLDWERKREREDKTVTDLNKFCGCVWMREKA